MGQGQGGCGCGQCDAAHGGCGHAPACVFIVLAFTCACTQKYLLFFEHLFFPAPLFLVNKGVHTATATAVQAASETDHAEAMRLLELEKMQARTLLLLHTILVHDALVFRGFQMQISLHCAFPTKTAFYVIAFCSPIQPSHEVSKPPPTIHLQMGKQLQQAKDEGALKDQRISELLTELNYAGEQVR